MECCNVMEVASNLDFRIDILQFCYLQSIHIQSVSESVNQFKVLFLVFKSQLGSAPKYLCHHIRPLFFFPLFAVFALPNVMHLFMPRVRSGQPWPSLGSSLLLVRHSGITSLLIYACLISLLPFPPLSLS